jgi:hypothetical protein
MAGGRRDGLAEVQVAEVVAGEQLGRPAVRDQPTALEEEQPPAEAGLALGSRPPWISTLENSNV